MNRRDYRPREKESERTESSKNDKLLQYWKMEKDWENFNRFNRKVGNKEVTLKEFEKVHPPSSYKITSKDRKKYR